MTIMRGELFAVGETHVHRCGFCCEAEPCALACTAETHEDGSRTGASATCSACAATATCPRCGSEVHLLGVQWPAPGDREPGDTVEFVVQCYVEANGGGDPLGEFDDGEPCGEEITVFRRVLGDGRFGPVSQAEAQKP